MNQQYGSNFDARLGCWTYVAELPDGSQDYCMKPGAATVIRTNGTEHLHFFAYSRPDIDDDPSYSYRQSAPGLMGAFEVRVESTTHWELLAASKELAFGSVGNCGCDDARLVRLGKDYYGWQFTSGGVWQGVAVINHNLVAPHEGKFTDISAIPKVTESEQEVEYAIRADDADTEAEMFPLLVTRTKVGESPKTIKVPFDVKRWRYALPTEN